MPHFIKRMRPRAADRRKTKARFRMYAHQAGERIRELVESAGCELQYLPPYSPDLNKIEHCWFPIKNRVRKSKGSIENFRERVDYAVKLTS